MKCRRRCRITDGSGPLRSDSGGDKRSHRKQRDSPRQPLGRNIITSLWGNVTIKIMVGFLFLYPAFVAKRTSRTWLGRSGRGARRASARPPRSVTSPAMRLAARLKLGRPSLLVVRCATVVTGVCTGGGVLRQPRRRGDRGAGHIRPASAIAKASLDASSAGRSARGVARVGVRPVGVAAAVGLGRGRRDRRAGVHRIAAWGSPRSRRS